MSLNNFIKVKNVEEIISIRIFNQVGKEVIFQNILNSSCTKIQVSQLSKGVYIVQLETTNNEIIVKRIF